MYLGDQYLREKLIKWRLDSELHCNQENVTGMKAQLDFGQDLAIHRNISEYSLQCGRKWAGEMGRREEVQWSYFLWVSVKMENDKLWVDIKEKNTGLVTTEPWTVNQW